MLSKNNVSIGIIISEYVMFTESFFTKKKECAFANAILDKIFVKRFNEEKMDIENKIIEELLRPLAVNKESLKLTNDGAYLFKKREMVVSTDMMIEGKHFDKSYNPKILASKLLRVNLSDLAAMGANPYGVMLNIAVPKKNSVTWVKDFCKGLKKDLKKFKLKLFGGDLSESSKIFLSATIFGFVTKRFLKQSIASEGSHIYVSEILVMLLWVWIFIKTIKTI